MMVLNVIYRLKSGTRPAFEAEALAIDVPGKTRSEDGNLAYGYFRPVDDEDALLCVERWRDKEAFLAHLKTEHVAALQEVKQKYVIETIPHEYFAD